MPGRAAPSAVRLGLAFAAGLHSVPFGLQPPPILPTPTVEPAERAIARVHEHQPARPPLDDVISLDPGEDPEVFVGCALDDDDSDDEMMSSSSDDEEDEGDSECLEDEAEGGGIGVEEDADGEVGSTDEASSSSSQQQDGRTGAKSVPPPPSRPQIKQAQWLETYLKKYSDQSKKRIQGKIPLYCEGRFWFSETATFMQLVSSDSPTPQTLYSPRVFSWDPTCFERIGCPRCKRLLVRHGEAATKRRVVDMRDVFYILAYRYRCPHCVHPVTGQRGTVTFLSTDRRILKMLSPALAAEFPAYLTHRSGISFALLEWMRSCFQNGMGGKQFSDCVRVQHLLHYDKLQLQYYHHLASRLALDTWAGKKHPPFLPYDNTSADGRHGYVPDGSFFNMVYNAYMQEYRAPILQHTSMLPLTAASWDTSYKVHSYSGLEL